MKTTVLAAIAFLAVLAYAPPAMAETHQNSGSTRVREGDRDRDRDHDRDRGGRGGDHRGARVEVKIWVPGHYEISVERVWVSGYYVTEIIPARYERRRVQVYDPESGETWYEERVVLIEPEHVVRRWVEGYWQTREVRNWVPGYWRIEIR
ncbi:MAG: hypothetical protein WC712_00950 [Candidatus Brocadiia bacterium]